MNHCDPFVFYTERRLVELTGRRAHDLQELLRHLREVPGSTIFYHTHHRFLSHHFQTPVVYNDFAVWVTESLQEEALGEKLAALDLRRFVTIRDLREAIAKLIEDRLDQLGGPPRRCLPGQQFHFCKSKSFIMPTGIVASDPADFFAKLPGVTNISLYFHFLEARLRLGRPTNDFSEWFQGRGFPELARATDQLDPYLRTLDELKQELLSLGRKHGMA